MIRVMEDGTFFIGMKSENYLLRTAQQICNIFGLAVSQTNPDHFWRVLKQNAPLFEVVVFVTIANPFDFA